MAGRSRDWASTCWCATWAAPTPGATLGEAPSADPGGGGESAHAVPSGSGEAGSTPGSDPQPLPDASGGVLVQDDDTTPPAAQTQTQTPAQSQAEPMDEDEIQSGAPIPEPKTDPDAAAQALARARALDQSGDQAACMNAVEEAKSHLDPQ